MRTLRCFAATGIIVAAVTGCTDARRITPQGVSPGAVAGSVSSGIRDYTIRANDYAYGDLPLHAPAGWLTLRLVNSGNEQHMLGVLPVPPRYTAAGLMDSVVHLHVPGDLQTQPGVDVVSPGDTGAVTAYFPPGEYVVGCFVKSPDGTFHVVKGMVGSFDVIAYSDSGSVPAADAVVELHSGRVALSRSVRSGARTIRIRTDNPHWADFQVLRLHTGRTASDAIHWYDNRATVAPAADAFGGVSSLEAGKAAFITADFTPGEYVLLFPTGGSDAHPVFAQYLLTVASGP